MLLKVHGLFREYSAVVKDSSTSMIKHIPIVNKVRIVLLVLGNTNEKGIRISTRFPLLAFRLSITNINKRSLEETTVPTTNSKFVSLGPYGFVRATRGADMSSFIVNNFAHFLAAAGAAAIVWQTVDVGKRAIAS
ncbi:hypothetical protein P153DRAFT_210898 [Dothidotthia symphoricarpi CBS 119687]|uniref:Uncharacterized protein n=1 Tax=Dothidotthia symphoricarpi CBS 119687 TaxID=1392245 RepID=A0A6A6AGH5_9PLEO|nr:uncharacterized protein P153DRAFT_210898 [Dothidotthia symphoricarpi CBS 119687]KAF2131092.1 hypothetical protein P153DRAFT_210898 [Dothidotthia symphoricarpi CBS 119687]